MAYTVKQVAAMSGVSVRTLHFYDETGLLKPAHYGANGYRFYEEPQLLTLQQILFYRELGFELKQIKGVLGRADFEIAAALESHRQVLQKNLTRTHKLIETIDKTINHLKGTQKMKTEEMFAGFSVAAGKARFDEKIKLGEEPIDCKVSSRDTDGAMNIFEFNGGGGGPLHRHRNQDEWIYVIHGDCFFEVGTEKLHLTSGESIFIPRNTAHVWGCREGETARVINVYQPAGKIEEFFAAINDYDNLPTREQAINNTYTDEQVDGLIRLFDSYEIDLLGPAPILA